MLQWKSDAVFFKLSSVVSEGRIDIICQKMQKYFFTKLHAIIIAKSPHYLKRMHTLECFNLVVKNEAQV